METRKVSRSDSGRVKRRKTSKVPKTSTGSESLFALIKKIGQADKLVDTQATVQKLKERLGQPRTSPQSLRSRIPLQIDPPSARIIQAIPDLAGEIEDSTMDEWLCRLYNRIALAEFYNAYRSAQAKPDKFLQELDRNPLRHWEYPRTRNGQKRTKVKEKFTELVFCQSKGKRSWEKDSVCVNNWQSWGKPWFELTNRFGGGILLLVPEEMTNRRQVSYHMF